MTAAIRLASDAAEWDRFVAGASDGSILQSWAWGELKAGYGWQPRRFFWEQDGVLRGAVSILRRRLPGGLTMDYAPYGPVLNGNLREWPAFWAALRPMLAANRGTIFKVEPQWPMPHAWILEETSARSTAAIQHRATALVDLTGGDAVFDRMSASARRNMRVAERHGVVIERSDDPMAVDQLYGLLAGTAARQRFIVRPRQYYRDVFEVFNASDPHPSREVRVGAVIYLASHAGEMVAASMMIRYGKRLTYLFSGSSDRGRDLKAPYLIQRQAILEAQTSSCSSYDLWGIPVNAQPGDPGWGYAHFKAMLGGVPIEFSGAWDLPVRRPLAAAYHFAERMIGSRAA